MTHTDSPLSIVLFGATGDLAQKKLFPALLELYTKNLLPSVCTIVAFSRRPWSDEEFRAFTRESFAKMGVISSELEDFLQHVIYHEGQFDLEQSYDTLAERLEALHGEVSGPRNTLIYLSIAPSAYELVSGHVGRKIAHKKTADRFTRILIEKPFGNDSASAQVLNDLLLTHFAEEDIFRIDHYLAKPGVQAFLEKQKTLQEYWNNEYIASVSVRLLEKGDIEKRGSFYEATGALRDVGQNHVLELLVLAVSGPRTEILSHLIPGKVARGQYEGYLTEVGKEQSDTETYFKVKTEIDMPEWKGVSIFLESGKALAESVADITVSLKKEIPGYGTEFRFQIQPYDRGTQIGDYAKVFQSAVQGDHAVFVALDEVKAAWDFVGSLRASWREVPLQIYKKGADSSLFGGDIV